MKTLIFDFGRVIGFFDYRLALERIAPHAETPVEPMQALLYDNPLEDDYESGRISSEEFLRRVRELCRARCPDDVLAAAYCDMFWPNAELCALIPRLKPRYRLLLASNTTELHSRHFRRQFADTLRHFDHLVLSHEVGHRKPRRDFYEHCQRHAHCQPHECVFIDDLPQNVEGARALGWHGIVYTGVEDLRERLNRIGVRTEGPASV